jgi:hypothetical protein
VSRVWTPGQDTERERARAVRISLEPPPPGLPPGEVRVCASGEAIVLENNSARLLHALSSEPGAAPGFHLHAAGGPRLATPCADPNDPPSTRSWKGLARAAWRHLQAGRGCAATLRFWEETPAREQAVVAWEERRGGWRPQLHRRRLRSLGDVWRVEETVTGRGRQPVELRVALPGAVVAADTEGARADYADGWRLRLRLETWQEPEVGVEPGWCAPKGGSPVACPVLAYRWHVRLPFSAALVLQIGRPMPARGEEAPEPLRGELVVLQCGPRALGPEP